jgi:adenylate kinase
MIKKKVYLFSINVHKLNEYTLFFKNYDVEVILKTDFNSEGKSSLTILDDNKGLLNEEGVIALFREETNLYNYFGEEIKDVTSQNDMDIVYTTTKLYLQTKDSHDFIKSERVSGFIDYSKKSTGDSVFGWDDVFILDTLGLSYQELKEKNMKNHCRQEILSKFVADELYYEENVELNFNKQHQKNVIEFSSSLSDFIGSNKYINMQKVKDFGFDKLFNIALSNGGFFRSSKNRRQKNYWIPGLNAGLPLVPKKDEIHELTFFIHDLCHFMMPDLVYAGHTDKHSDQVYILYRMMSESITMVMADMYFIDCLNRSDVEYDFDKRKIYPLYKAIKAKNPTVEVKDVLYANMKYCLFGDDLFYKNMINVTDYEVLEDFKKKYEPFFIEDFKWTKRNLDNMKSNKSIFRSWSNDNRKMIASQKLNTVNDFVQLNIHTKSNPSEVAEDIFKFVLNNIISQKENDVNLFSKEKNITDSFKKYMLGQIVIFYKFDFIPISKVYLEKIQSILNQDIILVSEIKKVRNLYTSFLDLLEKNYKLINKDDLETYKDVFPVFDSFFVFYDEDESYYKNLKETSRNILNSKEGD